MKTAKDYQQEFRLKDDELAQFDEFLNDLHASMEKNI